MAARIGNIIFGVLNVLFIIAGLMMIGWVAYLDIEYSTECYKLKRTQAFITGISMIFMSLLGLIGAYFRANIFLRIYIILMILWVLVLSFSAGYMFLTDRSSPEQAHKSWLNHNNFSNGKYWTAIKNCLIDANVCQGIDGCYRPPEFCEFEFKNATFWTLPKRGVIKRYGNCMAWNNRPDILCFNCDRCKETIVGDLRNNAKHMAIGLTCELVLLVIVCILGFCVRINNNKK